jgi:glycosyltransferase involved in cell wall biosynthesis
MIIEHEERTEGKILCDFWRHAGVLNEQAEAEILEISKRETIYTSSLKVVTILEKLGIDWKWRKKEDYPKPELEIDFIIPVRDRDVERLKRCVNSLKSQWTKRIIVVDYGSKEPIKLDGVEIIRVEREKYPIWNKSHVLNIGIKKSSANYVGTVDVDIVIGPSFIAKVLARRTIEEPEFFYCGNVMRIEPRFLDKGIPHEVLKNFAKTWDGGQLRNNGAVGGIQIFPREWIFKIGGYDENFKYWCGPDSDMLLRAVRSIGSTHMDAEIIYHQEHERKKWENLEDPNEIEEAKLAQKKANDYMWESIKFGVERNDNNWGIVT